MQWAALFQAWLMKREDQGGGSWARVVCLFYCHWPFHLNCTVPCFETSSSCRRTNLQRNLISWLTELIYRTVPFLCIPKICSNTSLRSLYIPLVYFTRLYTRHFHFAINQSNQWFSSCKKPIKREYSNRLALDWLLGNSLAPQMFKKFSEPRLTTRLVFRFHNNVR